MQKPIRNAKKASRGASPILWGGWRAVGGQQGPKRGFLVAAASSSIYHILSTVSARLLLNGDFSLSMGILATWENIEHGKYAETGRSCFLWGFC